MEQERWVVLEGTDELGNRDEVSWHKTKDKAIAVATKNHQRTGLAYWIDLEYVLITREGRSGPVASSPDQWYIGP